MNENFEKSCQSCDPVKTISIIIETSLIALLVFTPLARGTVQVWAISVAHFITLVMLTAYLLRIVFGPQPKWVKTPLDLPLIALFVLAVISCFSSIELHTSLIALMKLANYILLYFIIVNTTRQRDQVRRVAYTITIVGVFCSGIRKNIAANFAVEFSAFSFQLTRGPCVF